MTSLAPRSAAAQPLRRAAGALLLGGGLAAFGLLVAIQYALAVGLVLVVAAVAVAFWRPIGLAGAAIVLMAVVPVYTAPAAGPLVTHPTVLCCWLVALVLAVQTAVGRIEVRPNVVDGAVGLVFVGYALSVLLGVRPPTDFVQIAETSVGPYLALRLLVAQAGPGWLPRLFAAALLVSLPFVLLEGVTGTNPFDALQFNAAESAAWGGTQERFGSLRAEGAFGQSISLAQFAGTGMLLALGGAVLSAGHQARRWWAAVFVAGAVQIALSNSRTGWIVVALGIVLIAWLVTEGNARVRLLTTVAAAGVAAVALLVVTGQFDRLVQLFADNSNRDVSASDQYRQILLERALAGDGLSLFGERISSLGAGIDTGTASIDNAFLAVAADWGYVGLVTLALVGASLLVPLWRLRRTRWALVPAVALANFAGLVTVAVNTQTKYWLWMLVGASAAALDRGTRRADP